MSQDSRPLVTIFSVFLSWCKTAYNLMIIGCQRFVSGLSHSTFFYGVPCTRYFVNATYRLSIPFALSGTAQRLFQPKNIYQWYCSRDSTFEHLPTQPLPPPALSDSQVVGVYCRQSRERLGGQMFGRRRGVLSLLSLIYILWFQLSSRLSSKARRSHLDCLEERDGRNCTNS